MKNIILSVLAFLTLLLLFCACEKNTAPTASEAVKQTLYDSEYTLPPDTFSAVTPENSTQQATAAAATQSGTPTVTQSSVQSQPQLADGRLQLKQCGTYSGLYPEDGSDKAVESVAAILVENTSTQACQLCQMTFSVNGQTATFNLSELPAGKCAWVLESDGLQCTQDAVFTFTEDISIFRETASLQVFSVQAGEGSFTLKNDSSTAYPSLFAYYKLLGPDGNYLGGICYRVSVGSMAAGEEKQITAGHFYEGACELVGIYSD